MKPEFGKMIINEYFCIQNEVKQDAFASMLNNLLSENEFEYEEGHFSKRN